MSKLTSDITAEIVAVSDVHLSSLADERGQILLKLVETLHKANVSRFLLMGDIFDFCLGTTRYYRNKFKELGSGLEALAASGTEVIFFEGNHEFDVRGLPWKGVQFELGKERILELSDGTRIVAGHGDLVYGSQGYFTYRGIVKSAPSRLGGRLVPGKLLDYLCLNHAKSSRARDEFRTLDHEALLQAMELWAREHDAEHGLFGHFHVPYFQERSSGGRLMSFESWDRPNCLIVKEGGATLRGHWDTQSGSFLLSEAQELPRTLLASNRAILSPAVQIDEEESQSDKGSIDPG